MTMSQYAARLREKAAECERKAAEAKWDSDKFKLLGQADAYKEASHKLTLQLSHPLYWCDYVGDPNAPALKGGLSVGSGD